MLGVPCFNSASSGGINPSSFHDSMLGLSTDSSQAVPSTSQFQQLQSQQSEDSQQSIRSTSSPQHLQGTIV